MWFSIFLVFGVRFCPVSPVCLAERPPFGKELLIRSTLLCLFVALVVSHFGFEGRTLVLIALVPDHCLFFTSYSGHNIINRVFRRSSTDNSVVSGGIWPKFELACPCYLQESNQNEVPRVATTFRPL